MPSPIKNNNPDWHWLSAGNTCKICGSCETSLTLHYVNMHPTSEVISSRIAPEIAAFLRSPEYVPDCEAVNRPRSQHRHYKQICFFCNELKVYTKTDWINHMIKHTGYYTKQCDHCLKKLSRDSRRHHQCDGIIQRIRHPQFDEIDLIAYVCNLCNFLRFDEKEIGKHLRNEHEHRGNDGMEAFEEIIFLTFSNHLLPRRNDCETPTLDVDRMVNIKICFISSGNSCRLHLAKVYQGKKKIFLQFCLFQELRKKDPKSWTVEEPVSSNGELICKFN